MRKYCKADRYSVSGMRNRGGPSYWMSFSARVETSYESGCYGVLVINKSLNRFTYLNGVSSQAGLLK